MRTLFCDLMGLKNLPISNRVERGHYKRNHDFFRTDSKTLQLVLYKNEGVSRKFTTQNGHRVEWENYLWDVEKDLKELKIISNLEDTSKDRTQQHAGVKKATRLNKLNMLQEKVQSGNYSISITGIDTGLKCPMAGANLLYLPKTKPAHLPPTIHDLFDTDIVSTTAMGPGLASLINFQARSGSYHNQTTGMYNVKVNLRKDEDILGLERSITERKCSTLEELVEWTTSVSLVYERLHRIYSSPLLLKYKAMLDNLKQSWFDIYTNQLLTLSGADTMKSAEVWEKDYGKIFILCIGTGVEFKSKRGYASSIHNALQKYVVKKFRGLNHVVLGMEPFLTKASTSTGLAKLVRAVSAT